MSCQAGDLHDWQTVGRNWSQFILLQTPTKLPYGTHTETPSTPAIMNSLVAAVESANLNSKVEAATKPHSDWQNLQKNDPLRRFGSKLGDIIHNADGHNEMYGVKLEPLEDR